MDSIFQFCVDLLRELANFIGISYEAINIWLFVVIHPLITIYLFYLYRKYKSRLLQKLNNT